MKYRCEFFYIISRWTNERHNADGRETVLKRLAGDWQILLLNIYKYIYTHIIIIIRKHATRCRYSVVVAATVRLYHIIKSYGRWAASSAYHYVSSFYRALAAYEGDTTLRYHIVYNITYKAIYQNCLSFLFKYYIFFKF